MVEALAQFQGKRVLVTGHTGFKGSWLCEWLLALGAEVYGLSLPELPTDPCLFEQLALSERLTDLRGDIQDLPVVRKALEASQPDYLFHLAAQPIVRESYEEPLETFSTNVLGTTHVLEAVRVAARPLSLVVVTTDKVYRNPESGEAFAEEAPLGGHDPYSSSKACTEIVTESYARSFFHATDCPIRLATARAGNVIGGGDWARDRIVPDCMRALAEGQAIDVRNPGAIRPWQHVLEPLGGYLLLAARLQSGGFKPGTAYNFGPDEADSRTVRELVSAILADWPGEWKQAGESEAPHEANCLRLSIERAQRELDWKPRWGFEETVHRTTQWYRQAQEANAAEQIVELTRKQIEEYSQAWT